jgi:hypothetical protein
MLRPGAREKYSILRTGTSEVTFKPCDGGKREKNRMKEKREKRPATEYLKVGKSERYRKLYRK